MKRVLAMILILSAGFSFASEVDFFDDGKKKKHRFNRRVQHPAGFNIYAFGPAGYLGASFDYFVGPRLSLEVGASARNFNPDLGYFVGGRYHFFGKAPIGITPYLGVFSGFEYSDADLRNYNLYIPFGIQRIKKNKVTWSIEAAYQRNVYDPGNTFYGGGKLGIRF